MYGAILEGGDLAAEYSPTRIHACTHVHKRMDTHTHTVPSCSNPETASSCSFFLYFHGICVLLPALLHSGLNSGQEKEEHTTFLTLAMS